MTEWLSIIQQLYNMGLHDREIARIFGVKVQKIRELKLKKVCNCKPFLVALQNE